MRAFLSGTGGAVAPTVALALVGLLAIGGVAFDYSRLVGMHSELQNAADQAALAAATQLDGKDGARAAATAAASNLVANSTLISDDGVGTGVAIATVVFYQNKAKLAATTDANARYAEVTVDGREVFYALTPIVSAFSSGEIDATAMAGLGSSICKVPPIMICSPDPSNPFDADSKRGYGVVATGHSPGNKNSNQGGNAGNASNSAWAPGDFGFLQVDDPDTNSRNAALLKALAYASPPIDCVKVDDNKVSTGNPQGLYDAINTRFGIYDFNSSGNGNVLAPCEGGACPPAPNVRMDFEKTGNSCKITKGAAPGFKLPTVAYNPDQNDPYDPVVRVSSVTPTAMGLPRDNCHYKNYGTGNGLCPGGTGRFGNGQWGRQDYFTKYHNGNRPSSWQSITRYDTYLWELGGHMPTGGAPSCGTPAGGANRRVMTVAVVSNCADLHGASEPVVIDEWVDVFLVEPSSDDRPWNAFKDAIYIEIIGKSTVAGSGIYAAQNIRRDVPYIVE
tara:strand:+ start:1703 stop:3217 length:1515 start_codon:yes stop_codon:yes gene_type:complete